jgi:hypothetical protein
MDAIIELNMSGITGLCSWESELMVWRWKDSYLKLCSTLSSPTLNLQSPNQVKVALHEFGIPVEGTADEVLAKYEDQFAVIKDLRRYKKLRKQLNSYGEKLRNAIDSDGRLRGNWKLCGTDTFRMTCKDQICKDASIRALFQSKDAYLHRGNYSTPSFEYWQRLHKIKSWYKRSIR